METLSVRCNHCGAPLQVAGKTRFVTCQFCQSSLEVKQTESSVFTEEVAQIVSNTGKMAESLEAIQLQREIDRLDREHPQEYAAAVHPSGLTALMGCVGAIILALFIAGGVFFATSSYKDGAPVIFPIFGGSFALIGLLGLGFLIKTSIGSRSAGSSAYENRRAALTRRLNDLTKN